MERLRNNVITENNEEKILYTLSSGLSDCFTFPVCMQVLLLEGPYGQMLIDVFLVKPGGQAETSWSWFYILHSGKKLLKNSDFLKAVIY